MTTSLYYKDCRDIPELLHDYPAPTPPVHLQSNRQIDLQFQLHNQLENPGKFCHLWTPRSLCLQMGHESC